MTKQFAIIVERQPAGGYVATNPAFEGCYSQGDSIEEVLTNIREATELCLEEVTDTSCAAPTEVSLHLIEA